MTREEFTGVSVNDLDPSGTRISRSSEFSVVNSTEIGGVKKFEQLVTLNKLAGDINYKI